VPRKFSADVVTLNFRVPRKLHKRLEQLAKRNSTSINAEMVQRLEANLLRENWPTHEQLAMLLMGTCMKLPEAEALAWRFVEDMVRVAAENKDLPKDTMSRFEALVPIFEAATKNRSGTLREEISRAEQKAAEKQARQRKTEDQIEKVSGQKPES
jgi:hypothetical protein